MSGDAWPPGPDPGGEDVAIEGAAVAVEEEPVPVGTLFFMILFLLIMVGLWAAVYWMLLER